MLASFNQAFKIDRAIFDCWLKILYTCENTVLWLLEENELMKKNIHEYAEKNDIKKERIIRKNYVQLWHSMFDVHRPPREDVRRRVDDL